MSSSHNNLFLRNSTAMQLSTPAVFTPCGQDIRPYDVLSTLPFLSPLAH